MKMYGIVNATPDEVFKMINESTDYDYLIKSTNKDDIVAFLSDKNAAEYSVEIYEADEDGEFVSGTDIDSGDNFIVNIQSR